MATVTQTGPVAINTSVLNLSVLSGLPLTAHDPRDLVWNGSGSPAVGLFGTGIASVFNGVKLTDVTAGTFNRVDVFSGGQTLEITHFRASAVQFFDLMAAHKWGALAGLVFAGNDRIVGTGLNDTLSGHGGRDTLIGGSGDDHLNGGDGNDFLVMDSGRDTMTGGPGADTFDFGAFDTGAGIGLMPDFTPGLDRIDLTLAAFANVGTVQGPLAAAHFHIGAAAMTAQQGIIYTMSSGNLWADPDGNGPMAAVQFAHVPAGTALTLADFFVI